MASYAGADPISRKGVDGVSRTGHDELGSASIASHSRKNHGGDEKAE
jgi:hypothetical protein